jgi:hypothetical protein
MALLRHAEDIAGIGRIEVCKTLRTVERILSRPVSTSAADGELIGEHRGFRVIVCLDLH